MVGAVVAAARILSQRRGASFSMASCTWRLHVEQVKSGS